MEVKKMPSTPYIQIALVGFSFVISRLVSHQIFSIYDDAFITYRYAINLVDHFAFTYNLDSTVMGTTAPLFGLLVAALYAIGFEPDIIIPFVNILTDCIICFLVWRHFLGNDSHSALMFIGLYAMSPFSSRITVGGMEANLFVLVTMISFLLYEKAHKKAAFSLAAMNYFFRPEAVLSVALMASLEFFVRKKRVNAIRLGLLALLIVVSGMLIIFLIYGQPLPQSVLAKSHHTYSGFGHVLKNLLVPEPFAALMVPFAIYGAYTGWRENPLFRHMLSWGTVYLLVYIMAGPKMWSWYSLPIQVCLLMAAAVGFCNIIKLLPDLERLFSRRREIMISIAILAMIGVEYSFFGRDAVTKNIYKPLKEYCGTIADKDVSILASDIGIVGYACHPAKILDTAGLIWPEALSYGNRTEITRKYKPEYIFLVASYGNLKAFNGSELKAQYTPVMQLAKDGDTILSGNERKPDYGWLQEYILYHRDDD